MTTYFELDDVASNDHTHTLYEVPDDVDEGSPHVDVLGQLLHSAFFDLNVPLIHIDITISSFILSMAVPW